MTTEALILPSIAKILLGVCMHKRSWVGTFAQANSRVIDDLLPACFEHSVLVNIVHTNGWRVLFFSISQVQSTGTEDSHSDASGIGTGGQENRGRNRRLACRVTVSTNRSGLAVVF